MISYLNINSLTQTFGELKPVMNDGLVDMINIGESKLNDCVTDAVIHVQHFKTYRCDVTRGGHGLITYIRSSIIHMRRTDIEIYKSDSQYVVIEVWLRKEKWFIVSVYKPPPANVFISELSQMCDQLYCESDNIILIGDMNINMKGKVSELHDLSDLYNLKNIVKEYNIGC